MRVFSTDTLCLNIMRFLQKEKLKIQHSELEICETKKMRMTYKVKVNKLEFRGVKSTSKSWSDSNPAVLPSQAYWLTLR